MSLNMVVPPPNVDFSTEAGESNDSTYPAAVRKGLLTGFIPLPSNPETPLTDSQLDALFAPANRDLFCRALVNLAPVSGDHA